MAGMFYSLQEAAEKLNLTEQQLKEFVKEGKLREFRDGASVLFKINEVEALASETSIKMSKEPSAESEPGTDTDEISLAPETGGDTAAGDELIDADTVVDGQGINVLGETDSEAQLTEDTMAETRGTAEEVSLEEIEEDVNLDTFGSGSGLLDLSLQADDTSLGGILDEIYTSEGEQETAEGSALEVADEGKEMVPEEEEFAAPQPAPEVPAVAPAYAEPKPDTLSNAFGIMLFLPLLAIVYTAIVAVAGFNDVMPTILGKVQSINGPYGIHIIWYVMVGAAVAAGLTVGAAFVLSGEGKKAVRKPKTRKPKKVKKAKAKT
jgi:excisionase family DNA binding protein